MLVMLVWLVVEGTLPAKASRACSIFFSFNSLSLWGVEGEEPLNMARACSIFFSFSLFVGGSLGPMIVGVKRKRKKSFFVVWGVVKKREKKREARTHTPQRLFSQPKPEKHAQQ